MLLCVCFRAGVAVGEPGRAHLSRVLRRAPRHGRARVAHAVHRHRRARHLTAPRTCRSPPATARVVHLAPNFSRLTSFAVAVGLYSVANAFVFSKPGWLATILSMRSTRRHWSLPPSRHRPALCESLARNPTLTFLCQSHAQNATSLFCASRTLMILFRRIVTYCCCVECMLFKAFVMT